VQKDGIILTNQRSDAIKINKSVRDLLQKSGHVKDDLFTVDNGTRNVALAVGDRVLLTRNDYDIDVRNGQRGMITDAQEKTVTIAMDNGQIRTIDTDVYPNIEYGWASTTYKAQGATTERAYIYCHTKDPMSSQQASYVQISRAREETMIYAVRGERSVERRWNPGTENSLVTKLRQREAAFEDLCTSWSKDAGKETTLDYEKEQTKEIVKEIQHELEM
jgi:ATP-dependent exoDNAse (exonuclease V) alpha subunit